MWNWIRSLFVEPSERPADYETIKSEVESVLRLDLGSDEAREASGDLVGSVLQRLEAEIENVTRQANGYPANPISGLVWMNGAGYGNLACELTHHFRAAGWLKREENASALWAKAILAVCSHYHHMVGPAMIANANCHDRLGNAARASQMYGGVVKDFVFIVENCLNESESPSEEDRIALQSLQTATERLLSRGTHELDGINLSVLPSKISNILSRQRTN